MKKRLTTIAVILCAIMLLPSCKMRPKDVKRLQEQAEAGNFKALTYKLVQESQGNVDEKETVGDGIRRIS